MFGKNGQTKGIIIHHSDDSCQNEVKHGKTITEYHTKQKNDNRYICLLI